MLNNKEADTNYKVYRIHAFKLNPLMLCDKYLFLLPKKSGIGRTTLYRSLQSGKMRFETLSKILDAMDYRLAVVAK